MSEEKVEVIEPEVLEGIGFPEPSISELVDALQALFNEVIILKNALAENCRRVAELEARDEQP